MRGENLPHFMSDQACSTKLYMASREHSLLKVKYQNPESRTHTLQNNTEYIQIASKSEVHLQHRPRLWRWRNREPRLLLGSVASDVSHHAVVAWVQIQRTHQLWARSCRHMRRQDQLQ